MFVIAVYCVVIWSILKHRHCHDYLCIIIFIVLSVLYSTTAMKLWLTASTNESNTINSITYNNNSNDIYSTISAVPVVKYDSGLGSSTGAVTSTTTSSSNGKGLSPTQFGSMQNMSAGMLIVHIYLILFCLSFGLVC